jgi:hypothetical protein
MLEFLYKYALVSLGYSPQLGDNCMFKFVRYSSSVSLPAALVLAFELRAYTLSQSTTSPFL